jgi:hypothetical protein
MIDAHLAITHERLRLPDTATVTAGFELVVFMADPVVGSARSGHASAGLSRAMRGWAGRQ